MLTKLRCALFGHRWKVAEGDHPADIGAARTCACGASIARVTWERTSEQWVQASKAAAKAGNVYPLRLDKPTRPAPPMPKIKPPRQ